MAATKVLLAIHDVTVRFKSGDETPNTLDFVLTEGSITIQDGGFNSIMATDADGTNLEASSPRKAGVAQYAGFTINGKLFDPGKNASSAVYADLVRNEGVCGGWTQTIVPIDDGINPIWDADIIIGDRSTDAELKGTTFAFANVQKQGPGLGFDISRDGGAMVSGHEWQSLTSVHYASTRAT